MRILMVCLGNICRSPLAHGLLRSKMAAGEGEVDSAGTAGYHIGEAPDSRMIRTARKHGLDISDLRGRQFVPEDFDRYDRIYAMDESNRQNILQLAQSQVDRQKVDLILNELYPGEDRTVPDPYYGGDDGFEAVYQMLDRATDKIIQALRHGD